MQLHRGSKAVVLPNVTPACFNTSGQRHTLMEQRKNFLHLIVGTSVGVGHRIT